MDQVTGKCLCGAVTVKATPKNEEVGVCHCSVCRRWAAGPFFGVDCGDQVSIDDEDALGVFDSSKWAERAFCKQCGTPLIWRTKDRKANIVSVSALEGPQWKLGHEVFIDDKPDYYELRPECTQLTGQQVFDMFKDG